MFWALSNDSEGPQSLVGAAHDALHGFDAVLGGDGRFSITDFTALA
jgi:hypothetical protein